MAKQDRGRDGKRAEIPLNYFKRGMLLVPEAPMLFALLLIGWAYGFPPAVSGLAVLVVALFITRCFLLTSAAHELDNADYRKADRFGSAALRMHPWSADALTLQANSHLLQGNDTAAEILLRKAMRVAPESETVHSALAATLLARGDFTRGREHAMTAERLAAGSPHAAQHLSWLALHIDDDPEGTTRRIDSCGPERLEPRLQAPLLVLRGEAYLARGATAAARETLVSIKRLLPQCPVPQQAELSYHLGRLHTLLGDEGGRHFRRSVDLDPQGRWAQPAWRAAIDETSCNRQSAVSHQPSAERIR